MAEADLYPHVLGWLEGSFGLVRKGVWSETHRKALVTAQLDWISAGAWMRPDLAMVHVHRRRFETTSQLDLYSIEVKPPGAQVLAGLHQALAYGRFADFAVLVASGQMVERYEVESQAARFGVGLVLYDDPEIWRSYETCVEPKRTIPDPDLRDMFLTAALTADNSVSEVLGWLGVGERQ